MKKYLGRILENLLKIWGAAWIGCLISFVPMYIARFNFASPATEKWISGIVGCIGTMAALFLFFKWEGRKREARIASKKELILFSVTPTILWSIIGCLFFNPFLVLTNVIFVSDAILGYEAITDYAFFEPLPYALLFSVFYSASILGGYLYGRRVNDL